MANTVKDSNKNSLETGKEKNEILEKKTENDKNLEQRIEEI